MFPAPAAATEPLYPLLGQSFAKCVTPPHILQQPPWGIRGGKYIEKCQIKHIGEVQGQLRTSFKFLKTSNFWKLVSLTWIWYSMLWKLKHKDGKLVNLWIDSTSILRTILAQVPTFITYKAIGKLSSSCNAK